LQNRSIVLLRCAPQFSWLHSVDFSGGYIDETLVNFLHDLPNPLFELRLRRATVANEQVLDSLIDYLISIANDLVSLDLSMLLGPTATRLIERLFEQAPSWPCLRNLWLTDTATFSNLGWISKASVLEMLSVSVSMSHGFEALQLMHDHCSRLQRVMLQCTAPTSHWSWGQVSEDIEFEDFKAAISERCLHQAWLKSGRICPDIRLVPSSLGTQPGVSSNQFALLIGAFPSPLTFIRFWKEHADELSPLLGQPDFSCLFQCFNLLKYPLIDAQIFQAAFFYLVDELKIDLATPLPCWERDDGASPLLLLAAASISNPFFARILGVYLEQLTWPESAAQPPKDKRGRNLLMYSMRGPGCSLVHDSVLKMFMHHRITLLEKMGAESNTVIPSFAAQDFDGNTALHHILFPGTMGAFAADISARKVAISCLDVANADGHTPVHLATFLYAYRVGLLKFLPPYAIRFQPVDAQRSVDISSERAKYHIGQPVPPPLFSEWLAKFNLADYAAKYEGLPMRGPNTIELLRVCQKATPATFGFQEPEISNPSPHDRNDQNPKSSSRNCVVS
jgi:hypothetical protein